MTARNHWTRSAAAASGSTSAPLLLPRRIGNVSVVALPQGGASATVQYALDDHDDVMEGNATWLDWEPGPVTSPVARALAGPVTAIRIASTSGPSTLKVVGWFDY